jgi:hypothetical protein
MALAIACFGCKMFPAAPQWSRMTRPYIGKPTIKNFRPSRI